MLFLALILLGFVASAYGTIIGAGGGFLFVPALLTFYQISPEAAAATGLAVVFINAVSGMPMLMKQRRVLIRTGLLLSLGAAPATFLGKWLVTYSPEAVFYALFACLLIGLGLFLTLKKPKQKQANTQAETAATAEAAGEMTLMPELDEETVKTWKLIAVGGLLGVVSSFFGIGGGWLLVPILVYGFSLPIKSATATSMFSLALYSLIGLIPSIVDGAVDWQVVAMSGIGVLIGAQVGAILSKKMKGATITRLLAVVVIVMGINMFFQM
ncbi:sulfite exporter TauE/SafE family protein [Bacillus piscicola]|uniref:sulfite exporter TauE/SafE family protein n=1 Tax=Bacillus piscicola TaxID=1632684 RepID=UPI001F09BE4B|nr:sulfite exporter TauE/SafE family protein [Bacillus piscicola]